jgi:ParB-like chromosome segregation protein Spo0J
MTLKIQYKPIADLIPYARNSRTHDEAQVAQIAASIREFGWTNPVLLDGNNGIIAGHGRVLAAEKHGRHGYLMELDPKYCDVIVKRWEEFTGKKATLLNANLPT